MIIWKSMLCRNQLVTTTDLSISCQKRCLAMRVLLSMLFLWPVSSLHHRQEKVKGIIVHLQRMVHVMHLRNLKEMLKERKLVWRNVILWSKLLVLPSCLCLGWKNAKAIAVDIKRLVCMKLLRNLKRILERRKFIWKNIAISSESLVYPMSKTSMLS